MRDGKGARKGEGGGREGGREGREGCNGGGLFQ